MHMLVIGLIWAAAALSLMGLENGNLWLDSLHLEAVWKAEKETTLNIFCSYLWVFFEETTTEKSYFACWDRTYQIWVLKQSFALYSNQY